jgi:transcription initiation factor TFIIF subunit alpha
VSQRNKARLFQKRVKEVHKASAVARRTWNDERLPWVLEDFDTPREWTSARSAPPSGINALQEALEARSKGLPSVLDVKPEELVKEEKMEEGSQMAAAARKKDANHAPWIGKLEGDADDGENHVLFVFDAEGDGGFRVVPVTKSYRFLQKPKHANAISWEEAEKEVSLVAHARRGACDADALRTVREASEGSLRRRLALDDACARR